jgi:hypothetical protein
VTIGNDSGRESSLLEVTTLAKICQQLFTMFNIQSEINLFILTKNRFKADKKSIKMLKKNALSFSGTDQNERFPPLENVGPDPKRQEFQARKFPKKRRAAAVQNIFR